MERYARLVLILFEPFRSQEDLTLDNYRFPFVAKLRQRFRKDQRRRQENKAPRVFTDDNMEFLQNIQNSRANSLRLPPRKDELHECTEPFTSSKCHAHDEDDDDDDYRVDEEENFVDLETLESMFDNGVPYDPQDYHDSAMGKTLSFEEQKNRGKNGSGYNKNIRPAKVEQETNGESDPSTSTNTPPFVHARNVRVVNDRNTPAAEQSRKTYSRREIVRHFFRVTSRRTNNNLFPEDVTETVPLANGTAASVLKWSRLAGLDNDQCRAFECILATFILTFYEDKAPTTSTAGVAANPDHGFTENDRYNTSYIHLKLLMGTDDDSLVCFLHGPGGSGKTTVINLVQGYAKEFCEMLGHPYTHRTIVITAMSGVAATLILGETTHKAIGLNRDEIDEEEKDNWTDTRLVFIDENSFASKKDYANINNKCQTLRRKPFLPYGGLNIIFSGDLSQLEPVRGDPIYEGDGCAEFEHFVNVYIELNGMHRFRTDPEWGHLLRRFREGNVTAEDIATINNFCFVANREDEVPDGVHVACYANKERNAVNCSVFEKYCEENVPNDGTDTLEDAVLIFMDNLHMKDADRVLKPVTNPQVKQLFFQHCGESALRVDDRAGVLDSVLKLYPNCPMMMTKNKDVSGGQANGSKVLVKAVQVKDGEVPYYVKLDNGVSVRAYNCSQVASLLLTHRNPLVRPAQFEMKAEDQRAVAEVPCTFGKSHVSIKGRQFQVVSNSATTGHKLQGATVESLLVNDWSYRKNWVYVVLSRVKTMAGLFIQQKLRTDLSHYRLAPGLVELLEEFREWKAIPSISDDDYAAMSSAQEE